MPKSSTTNRLADLEAEVASLKAAQRAAGVFARRPAQRVIRWARTAEGETDYPNGTGTPDTYPIVFLDGTYTQTQGNQSPTWVELHAEPKAVVHNIAGQYYIPLGTEIPVWFDRGRWWTDWHYTNVFHVTLESPITTVGAGATCNVFLPTGQLVEATNWSADTMLTVGDKCQCFQDQTDENWYLIKTGGESQTKIWHSLAIDDIAAGATATVELSTGAEVEATNWSDDVDIDGSLEGGDKIHVYQDPHDSNYYAIKSGGGGGVSLFKGELAGTLLYGDATGSADNLESYTAGAAPSGTVAFNNILHFAGTNGEKCILIENGSDDPPTYDLLAVEWDEIERVSDLSWDGGAHKLVEAKRKFLGKNTDSPSNEDTVAATEVTWIEVVSYDSEAGIQTRTRTAYVIGDLGTLASASTVVGHTTTSAVYDVAWSGTALSETPQTIKFLGGSATPSSPSTLFSTTTVAQVSNVEFTGTAERQDFNVLQVFNYTAGTQNDIIWTGNVCSTPPPEE